MKIPHFVWIAGICGRLALAARKGLIAQEAPGDQWPNAWIEVCNGANFTQECGKVDMSESFLGKCKTIPYGIFYDRVMSARLVGSSDEGCCELFEGINCIGSRVMFQSEISDLHGHCGFGGGPKTNETVARKRPSDAPGQTKSFACHKPETCQALRNIYQDCTIVRPYSTFFP